VPPGQCVQNILPSFEREQLLIDLRANNAVTRERLAALEADPIAMADFLAAQNDDFIRKMQSNELVYKENPDALVPAAAPSPFDDPAFFEDIAYIVAELRREFETGDRILKQRVQELEVQVKDLSEKLSVFNRVAASCEAVLQTALQMWINKQSGK
jgi:hypothetical protein